MLPFSIVLTTSTNAMTQSIVVHTGQSMFIALAFYTISKQTQAENKSFTTINKENSLQLHYESTFDYRISVHNVDIVKMLRNKETKQ